MHFVVKSNQDSRKLCQNMKQGNWMVLYKADWCGHCKTLQPEWNEFVQTMNTRPDLNLAEVESSFLPAMKHQVEGYPTIKMFHNNRPVADFNDSRDVDGLERFALSNIPKPVSKTIRIVSIPVKRKSKRTMRSTTTVNSINNKPAKKPVKKKSNKPVKKKSSNKPKKPTKRAKKKSTNNNLVKRMKKRRMKTQKPSSSINILRNLKRSMSNIQKQSVKDKQLLKTLESITSL